MRGDRIKLLGDQRSAFDSTRVMMLDQSQSSTLTPRLPAPLLWQGPHLFQLLQNLERLGLLLPLPPNPSILPLLIVSQIIARID
jgi:hypothetical protein